VGINKDQLRELIKSVLHYLEPEIHYSEDAVELTMLTIAQESHMGDYINQVKGPAKGIIQMEPATEKDIWDNFLKYKPVLAKKIDDLKDKTEWTDDLMANLNYQIAILRVHYFRVKESLPRYNIISAMADYYKRHYNTIIGKATVQEAIDNYKRYCL